MLTLEFYIRKAIIYLWFVGTLAADVITTIIALSMGFNEANPLMRIAMMHGLWSLIIGAFALMVFGGTEYLLRKYPNEAERTLFIPFLCGAFRMVPVINNLLVILFG